jgi:activator of 2-hydroxyglutaryl-CoA dehydratase
MALLVGLDVGSTTTKVYAMHEDMTEAWWGYRRHGACQAASVRAMLGELADVLQTVGNLITAFDITDEELAQSMDDCLVRNQERGRL